MNEPNLQEIIANYANRQLEQRKAWYSRAANAYNQARPHYPPSLVAQVADIAQLSTSSTILEIGCGPGTARFPLLP